MGYTISVPPSIGPRVVLDTARSASLLRSRRRTFLFCFCLQSETIFSLKWIYYRKLFKQITTNKVEVQNNRFKTKKEKGDLSFFSLCDQQSCGGLRILFWTVRGHVMPSRLTFSLTGDESKFQIEVN